MCWLKWYPVCHKILVLGIFDPVELCKTLTKYVKFVITNFVDSLNLKERKKKKRVIDRKTATGRKMDNIL